MPPSLELLFRLLLVLTWVISTANLMPPMAIKMLRELGEEASMGLLLLVRSNSLAHVLELSSYGTRVGGAEAQSDTGALKINIPPPLPPRPAFMQAERKKYQGNVLRGHVGAGISLKAPMGPFLQNL